MDTYRAIELWDNLSMTTSEGVTRFGTVALSHGLCLTLWLYISESSEEGKERAKRELGAAASFLREWADALDAGREKE